MVKALSTTEAAARGRTEPAVKRAPQSAEAGDDRQWTNATTSGVQFEVHDREQLEIRFNHGISSEPGDQLFEADTYFFIPKNVGVNRTNYTTQNFYGDVTALMRLDAAPLPLCELANPQNAASPLHRLHRALELLQVSKRPPASQTLAFHAKLYAYLHTEAVRRETALLTGMLKATSSSVNPEDSRAEFIGELEHLIEDIRESLSAFRKLRAALWPYEKTCHKALNEATRIADEYMSLFLEQRLAALSGALSADPRHFDGTCFVRKAEDAIRALAKDEAAHRTRCGFVTLVPGDDVSPEYFTYRCSLIKKAVHQALYLDAREATRDTFTRNAIGAVGAALAAIWALAAQLPTTIANLGGNTKLFVCTFAVLAYVMKDRIKTLTGEYLTAKLRRYDHSSTLYGRALEAVGLSKINARLRESMRFIPYDAVDENIRRVRLEQRTVRKIGGVSNEEVICYKKSLLVQANDTVERMPQGYAVRDILRLNIRHFLVRLDDPSEKWGYFDVNRNCFGEAKLPKVYHLHAVICVRRTGTVDRPAEESLEHLRVVLNKNGIVRVERLPVR